MNKLSLIIKTPKVDNLATTVFESKDFNHYILFLHGGATDVGKGRFEGWQNDFTKDGIGSVAFDFVGVDESMGDMSKESLSKRSADAEIVARWMIERYPSAKLSLCGVSMGAYVALDLVHKMPNIFNKLIIQVPAAYSPYAHDLHFDISFTNEIRKSDSWLSSNSFGWFKEYSGEKLLIACDEDKTIPREIIERYKSIGQESPGFSFLNIVGAPHNIWKAEVDKERILKEAYETIRDFLMK